MRILGIAFATIALFVLHHPVTALNGSSTSEGAENTCAAQPMESEEQRALESAQRWRALIAEVAREGGEIEWAVHRRAADETPKVEFDVESLNAFDFSFADLPKDLQAMLVQLRPGDSVRYRLTTKQGGFVIDSITPAPSYIERPETPPGDQSSP